jgi:hypothetical protein
MTKNSFEEFRRVKALNDASREQQCIADLMMASSRLDELTSWQKQARLALISQEILEILNAENEVSGKMMDALNSVTDDIIEDMGAELGLIHTYLRHIQHCGDGAAYNARMEEKLAERFKRFVLTDVTYGQFLNANRDGSLALNSWGTFMMERMDERLVLASYNMPESFDFKQIHGYS